MSPSTRLVASLLALVALVGAAGCATDTATDTATHTSTDTAVAPALDEEAIVAATVRVRADGCGPRTELGTGTVIPDGLVLTAAHVVAGADRVEIVDASATTTSADVVWFDPDLDVAALRPSTPVGPPSVLRDDVARPGERGVVVLVTADGTTEALGVDVVQRVTIRTTDIYGDAPVERPGLRIDARVEPGDSGAMVHLAGGGVGIVWSRSTTDDDQAWTVDVPAELLDPSSRRSLLDPVAVGRCR